MKKKKLITSDSLAMFVLLLPLLITVVLLYVMLFWTFYTSLSNWKGVSPNYTFVGLKWYKMMFTMDRFWTDFMNNLKWLTLGVLPTLFLALVIAYILEMSNLKKIETYLRTLILYPSAMSFVVTGTIWSWIYQPDKGVLNTIFSTLRLDFLKSMYTANPRTATYWLILIFIWQFLGLAVIILQSAFRSSELQEMIESALVDGASKTRILFQIIVPNIRSGLLILGSLLLISALKVFDIVYIVTFGGPGYSTDVLAFFMFIATFQQHLVSLGACLSMIIFIMAFMIIIPYTLYAFKRWFA
ncbi:MAG: sugar ABC transporter permease [Thermotogae bacterium]|nr:MAG: sugar ABC transporter permease [Thermotogota bacterium]